MFKFKQFTIHQDKTSMKVGTDGVLIGAWATIDPTDRYILDIGTGTGLIALMLAQRTPSAEIIDAAEIDTEAAAQATENCSESIWAQKVNIHNVDICNFNQNIKYNSIVSNPPFFNNSLLCPSASRTAARHTVTLPFEGLISAVVRLLDPAGRFSVILPTAESNIFDKETNGRLYLWRRCLVSSRDGSDTKRIMSEYRLSPNPNPKIEKLPIRQASSNEYSQEYRELTSEFYLKF